MADAATANDVITITLNVTAGISISTPPNTAMSNALGTSQLTAVGTTTWNVKTNNYGGYTLTLQAASTTAMQASSTSMIADYSNSGVPTSWTTTTPSFGFSGYGADVNTGTWGTGTTCSNGTSTINSNLKYRGFTTSPYTIAFRTSTTTSNPGVDTVVCYAVDEATSYIPSGTYTAFITATAVTN